MKDCFGSLTFRYMSVHQAQAPRTGMDLEQPFAGKPAPTFQRRRSWLASEKRAPQPT